MVGGDVKLNILGGLEGRGNVPPLKWELLGSGCGTAGKEDGLVFSETLLESLVDDFIVEVGIIVVHFLGIK